MPIRYYTDGCKFVLRGRTKSSEWMRQAIHQEGFRCGVISIIFCSDEALLQVNRTFLQHDYFTDIITFDYSKPEQGVLSGDLMISVDTVQNNAEKFGVSFLDELHRVMIHGILHLAGYGDKKPGEEEIMHAMEDTYLAQRERTNEVKKG